MSTTTAHVTAAVARMLALREALASPLYTEQTASAAHLVHARCGKQVATRKL
jgi:hypothetical protein